MILIDPPCDFLIHAFIGKVVNHSSRGAVSERDVIADNRPAHQKRNAGYVTTRNMLSLHTPMVTGVIVQIARRFSTAFLVIGI
jgi:hypothetical protein